MSKPFSWGMPLLKVCEKLLAKDAQICDLKYPKVIDLKTVDLKKLKVKDLKKILNDWDERCEGCVEKTDFVRRIEELKKVNTAEEPLLLLRGSHLGHHHLRPSNKNINYRSPSSQTSPTPLDLIRAYTKIQRRISPLRAPESKLLGVTHENFGSDHFMLEMVIQEPTRQRTRPTQVIDWDSFRTHRKEQATPPTIADIKAWTAEIVKQVTDTTQSVECAHLWERKKLLEALLATQKWDRDVRRRLTRAHTDIETYAIELTRHSWHNICDQMNKTPNARNTWKLLRHLMDLAGGDLRARQQLERIFHQYPGTPDELKQELIDTYIRPEPATSLSPIRARPTLRTARGVTSKSIKTALGLPMSTATHKLMALGISNTVSELIEATLTAQYEWLSLTHTGRAVLQQKRFFEKRFSGRPDVTYADASYHPSKPAMVAAALAPHRSWYTASSIRNAETVSAPEEVAIALALTDPITKVVISDSQQVIRNYDAGRIVSPGITYSTFYSPLLHIPLTPVGSSPRVAQRKRSALATLIHTAWTCTHYNTDNANTPESWESLLRTSEPADQRRLIQRAVEAAESQGIAADLL
ncbi:hypothetical protein HPB49_007629 [Dermacentor silvarum]|uniref:Uncharacterized protein n=1 Tax=Dermacentor silvarum TaxID=543639 RepID=A0ACB8DN19_DERSI|nr:hypothetical protein HPB49_007629 [Dermacentor silvarum]